MNRLRIASLALLSMLAFAAATSPGPQKMIDCEQLSSGVRGGYSGTKIYKCQVDLDQLKLIDRAGRAVPAPAGQYKIGPERRPQNVGAGGYLLK
jgi:hypothetical protein